MRTLAALLALTFVAVPMMEAKTHTPHTKRMKLHKAPKAKKHRAAFVR